MGSKKKTKLGNRFRRLWQASAASNLADGIGLTAAPLLAATLTRDPVWVAGLITAQRLPWFLFSLVSGALVDRLNRKQILAIGNLVRAAVLGLMGIAVWGGAMSLPLLYALFFLLGVVETFFDNATFAILPRIVPKEQLERANGRLFATQTVANEFVGPPIGSGLFAALPAAPFLLSAAAFGASSTLVFGLHGEYAPSTARRPQASMLSEIREGFSWFIRHHLIRSLAVLATIYNLCFTAATAILVLYAQEVLNIPVAGYGLLVSAAAVGGILGGLAAERVAARLGKGTTIVAECLLGGGALAAMAFTQNAVVAAALFALIAVGVVMGNTVIISLRQALIPDHLLGRVTSVYRLFVLGAAPLGAFLGGLLARAINLTAPFWIGGSLFAAITLVLAPTISNARIAEAEANAGNS